jgi:hypothetical protein
MKIAQSDVQLYGRSVQINSEKTFERFRAWVGNRPAESEAESGGGRGDQVRVSAEALRFFRSQQVLIDTHADGGLLQRAAETAKEAIDNMDPADELLSLSPRQQVAVLLIEALTGKKVDLQLYRHPKGESAPEESAADAPQRQGWGVEYDRRIEVYEKEEATFSAQGVVKTVDGREIAFDAGLTMSRERLTVEEFSFRAGDAALVDPLVINYGGNAAELTSEKTAFDLDADGDFESMSFVRSGSGFLVLDRNGDGAITDGLELFGPTTGNGFVELASFDLDANGWIDESDEVYDRLRLWEKASDGQDVYATLRDRNIGAIYTEAARTEYGMEDESGEKQGQLRATGVYLTEDGRAGTVQQVDLKA